MRVYIFTEAALERLIDISVMRRLSTDHAYNNAENAEDQAQREAEITDQVECELIAKYGQPS